MGEKAAKFFQFNSLARQIWIYLALSARHLSQLLRGGGFVMSVQRAFSQGLKRVVSFMIAFSCAMGPARFALAADENAMPSAEKAAQALNDAVNNPAAAADLEEINAIANEQAEGTKAWADQKESILPQLLEAAARLEAEARRIEELRGSDFLQGMIDKNQFMIDVDNFGTAEYRMIEGKRVPRILHDDEVYILVDEKEISRDSSHLRQYIARTHIESGNGRVQMDENGKPKRNMLGGYKLEAGRNLTIVFFNEDASTTEVVSMPKHHFTSWSWWKDYYYAKKKKPTWDDFTLALFSGGVMQVGLTFMMTMMKHHVLGTPISWTPALFTGIFGITIGTFASTYKNFTNNSISNVTRTLKRHFVSSMPYAYGLVIAMAPGEMHDKLAVVSLFTAVGLAKNLSLQVNGLSNNTASAYWSGINQIREKSRDSAGQITFNFNFTINGIKKTWKVINWSRSNFENQLLYLAPWSLNVLGLMAIGASAWSKIPGTEINIPIFQFAGIPIAMYWTKTYARKLADEAKKDPLMSVRARELEDLAQKYEGQWKAFFGMDVKDIPKSLVGLARRVGASVKKATVSCVDFLRSNKESDD
jgi:hypothetical protein